MKKIKYYPLPEVFLNKNDKRDFGLFVLSLDFMFDKSDMRLCYDTIIPDGKHGIAISVARNVRGLKINVSQNLEGTKFYSKTKNAKGKIEWNEITKENAYFIHRWITFLAFTRECLAINLEITKIEGYHQKKNGMSTKPKDPDFLKLRQEHKDIVNAKNNFVKTQKYEEAAKGRDDEKLKRQEIIDYLLAKYPKRKIFKSPNLFHVLFHKQESYTVNVPW